ncbi:single-stranded DNA-binding protein [bacterium]|nr:single-stranded DNA-binding protein [bacterium]
MGYLNKVLLIGRLGQDPEKRITPAGHSVVNVSLATTEYFKDKSGNRQEKTEWHKVVFWNRQAEIVEQYCKKGSQIYIEGALQTEEWQDKDGNKRQTTKIIARALQLLDPKSQGSQGSYQANTGQQNAAYNSPPPGTQNFQEPPPGHMGGPIGNDDFIEDDIPF